MFKIFNKYMPPLIQVTDTLLNPSPTFQQSLRTAFILKRRIAPFPHRKGLPPRKFRDRHYIYDLVKDTNLEKQKDLEVILTTYVESLGNAGQRVSLKPNKAYNSLILPGLAVYASPENIKKYENIDVQQKQYSSPYAKMTMEQLSKMTLSVVMNKETPWILKPWHIRTSFRKSGFHVPEDAIKLPDKPISGPDMNLEDKEFYITVTINNCETTPVRCRIHHWSTNVEDRLPYVPEFWTQPAEPIFEEDMPILDSLPRKEAKDTPKK